MYTHAIRCITFRSGAALTFGRKNVILCHVQRKNQAAIQQIANITSKKFRDTSIKKPAPWPYETKKYNTFWSLFDDTMSRFDENTKLIIIEGNIGAGKSSLAKALAEELDFHLMPEVNVDSLYQHDGWDLREYNHLMPHSFKICDLRTFYENPHHHNVAKFQLNMFRLRFEQYLDAMAHMLNTGQGVIMERCLYSDFVFVEAMHKMGYLSKEFQTFYYQVIERSVWDYFLRPHLILYLDVPSNILKERVKKRNIPYEVNSKVLTKEYFDAIEHFYKHEYLKKMSDHCELMIYDWSEYGDSETVVDDIEGIDFNKYDQYDLKMKDWRIKDTWIWNGKRIIVTNRKGTLMCATYAPPWDCPDVVFTGEDKEKFHLLMLAHGPPGWQYDVGFNPHRGNKVLFKTRQNYRQEAKFRLHLNE